MRLDVVSYEARLRAPFASAHGRTDVRRLVCVRLLADDGLVGYGEAAPLQSYDGVSIETVLHALESWRPLIEAGEPLPEDGLPQARAAIDLARWDLAGRRAAEPVWRLLGATVAQPVAVNATIAAVDPAAAAAQASRARAAGFRCVKVKVGLPGDAERVTAVRDAAGPGMAIRLDANGGWSVTEAIASLGALAPLGLELCEEPVHGIPALEAVAAESPVPVAADETTADPALLERRVCAAVCLKIASSGGISGLIARAERARAAGYEVYLASTLDGPLGIAAALHAATIIRPDRPSGLATLGAFAAEDPLPPRSGTMSAPDAPGLGVEPRRTLSG